MGFGSGAIKHMAFLMSFSSSSLCFFTTIAHLCAQGREAERLESGRESTLDHRVSYCFYPEPNDSANHNDFLVEPMDKMCGIVVVVGLALAGCATKTPENTEVTPPPVVVHEAPSEVTPSSPDYTVRYESEPASASAAAVAHSAPEVAQPVSETSRAEQCRKELDVLRVYNKPSYVKYEAEYQALAAKTAKYMEVKDSLSPALNDIVLPAHQYQIREFCFRLNTRLSELVLRQVK